MITNICLLLEALSILLCLHYLYGEKFRLDIETVSFLAIDMIMMQAIDYYHLPRELSLLIYPIIAVYCGIKFGFELKALIINNVLYLVIAGTLQLVVLLVLGHMLGKIQLFADIELLIANCITFIIMLFVLSRCKLNELSEYLQDKDRILAIALVTSVLVLIFWILTYKSTNAVELNQSVLLFITIVLICFLAGKLVQSKLKSREIETELKMHQIYAESFQNLIDNIRLRQHEFDNHINTIQGLRYTYFTYEELIKAQEAYGEVIIEENRYNKLLTKGNPILIGFLYGKFIEIEKYGIEVSYEINISELDINVPVYKLIEILGNLINNAAEALKTSETEKILYVKVLEIDKELEIEVRNTSCFINYDEIGMFFTKEYSKKGSGRGLGLYNVKLICEEYMLDIVPENVTIDNKNWLSFKIKNKKETV